MPLGVNNESIPNMVLYFSLMPLFMVEHFRIALNPNGPKRNSPEEVPKFEIFTIILRNPFPKHDLLPIETIVITSSNPT